MLIRTFEQDKQHMEQKVEDIRILRLTENQYQLNIK